MDWDMSVDFIEMRDRFLGDLRKLRGGELTYRRLREICYTVILLVQLLNGCRISEAIEGVRKAVNQNKSEVYVRVRRQRDNMRLIVIPSFIDEYLLGLVRLIIPFVNRDSVRMYCKYRYGINTHSLRYAFIRYLGEKGYSVQAIASITQHKNLNYILKYVQRKAGEDILRELSATS